VRIVPKRAAPTDHPRIELDAALPAPLHAQLYDRLRRAILAGQLPPGARVPSTRTLAAELGVSRGTTSLAYDNLVLEGYLESRVGRGTTVSRRLPTPTGASGPDRRSPAAAPQTPPRRVAARAGALDGLTNLGPVEGRTGGAFLAGQPALDQFPYEVWARLVARRARHTLAGFAYYQPAAGHEPLRAAIAAQIGISRGVRCVPEQIIITAGAQGALDLCARTLLDPGDAVWVEDPGYFGAYGALLAAGARLVPAAVDDEGLDVEAARLRCPAARLAVVAPSHQFPTGATMSLRRRLALVAWAEAAGAWVLEDDYDGEYRFGGRPLTALQGLDRADRVLYLGTFSKVLFPALRLGYVVAPPDLAGPLLAARRFIDGHPPILEQMALADFMTEGHYVRHLRRMLRLYGRRRDLLRRELRARLGDLLEVSAPAAGMHLVGWLPAGVDDERAAGLAVAAGVFVVPVSRFGVEPPARGGLVFGFAGVDEAGIRRGVERLAIALEAL
jgi:GntR family transcriptional regulator/MocR family aminotransferase